MREIIIFLLGFVFGMMFFIIRGCLAFFKAGEEEQEAFKKWLKP